MITTHIRSILILLTAAAFLGSNAVQSSTPVQKRKVALVLTNDGGRGMTQNFNEISELSKTSLQAQGFEVIQVNPATRFGLESAMKKLLASGQPLIDQLEFSFQTHGGLRPESLRNQPGKEFPIDRFPRTQFTKNETALAQFAMSPVEKNATGNSENMWYLATPPKDGPPTVADFIGSGDLRKLILQFREKNPQGTVITDLLGCYGGSLAHDLSDLPGVSVISGATRTHESRDLALNSSEIFNNLPGRYESYYREFLRARKSGLSIQAAEQQAFDFLMNLQSSRQAETTDPTTLRFPTTTPEEVALSWCENHPTDIRSKSESCVNPNGAVPTISPNNLASLGNPDTLSPASKKLIYESTQRSLNNASKVEKFLEDHYLTPLSCDQLSQELSEDDAQIGKNRKAAVTEFFDAIDSQIAKNLSPALLSEQSRLQSDSKKMRERCLNYYNSSSVVAAYTQIPPGSGPVEKRMDGLTCTSWAEQTARLLGLESQLRMRPVGQELTQEEMDAVLHPKLETNPLFKKFAACDASSASALFRRTQGSELIFLDSDPAPEPKEFWKKELHYSMTSKLAACLNTKSSESSEKPGPFELFKFWTTIPSLKEKQCGTAQAWKKVMDDRKECFQRFANSAGVQEINSLNRTLELEASAP